MDSLNEQIRLLAIISFNISVQLAEVVGEAQEEDFRRSAFLSAARARGEYVRLKGLLERRGQFITKPPRPEPIGRPLPELLTLCITDVEPMQRLTLNLAEWLLKSGDLDGAAHAVDASGTWCEQAFAIRHLMELAPGAVIH